MNETLLYIILGVLYLIFTALGRAAKKRQQKTQTEEPWSLEDALRDLQTTSEEQPEVAPVPVPQMPSDWPDEYTPYIPDTQNRPTEPPPIAKPAFNIPTVTERPAAKPKVSDPPKKSKPPSSPAITRLLNNPKSAREAIIVSEILRRPKGARGFPQPGINR